MRTRPLIVVVALLLASNVAASTAHASTTLIVSGNGINDVHLRASESATVATLTRVLGRPSTKLAATPVLTLCGVSATIRWSSMDLFFNHQRLVGISFGPGHSPNVRTAAGLRLGNTLGRARSLYGRKLTTSTSQGGAWFVATPVGRIEGFLNPSTARTPTSSARIWTIDVGVVGCPALSP